MRRRSNDSSVWYEVESRKRENLHKGGDLSKLRIRMQIIYLSQHKRVPLRFFIYIGQEEFNRACPSLDEFAGHRFYLKTCSVEGFSGCSQSLYPSTQCLEEATSLPCSKQPHCPFRRFPSFSLVRRFVSAAVPESLQICGRHSLPTRRRPYMLPGCLPVRTSRYDYWLTVFEWSLRIP